MCLPDLELVFVLNYRINNAAIIASSYGMIDGAHHKQWVIDQMLQAMLGENEYKIWLSEMNSDPEYPEWDTGIAP